MTVVVLQLVQLLLAVGIAGAFVRALLPRGSASEAAWARRRAEWLSVGFALLATYLVLVVARALTGEGGPNPYGMIPFLTLAALVPLAAVVLRAVWRRALAAAAAERGALHAPDLTAGPAVPARHRGLSGEDRPPTRW